MADTWLYWALRGYAVEGLGRLRQIQPEVLDAAGRAALHLAVAGLRYASGDVPGTAAPAAAAVEAARASEDAALLVESLVVAGIGKVAADAGGAAADFAEGRRLAAAAGDDWGDCTRSGR